MVNNLNKTLPQAANNILDAPITMDELQLAVKKEKSIQAPGIDGMSRIL